MASRRKPKKLKKEAIIRNSSNQVSHTIQKIKANERKYTMILVSFFFLLFCFIGYFTLRVHESFDTHYNDNVQEEKHGISTSGKMVTLTDQSIVSDSLGLQSEGFPFVVENYEEKTVHYRVILVNDEFVAQDCGCSERLFPISAIHYSLDSRLIQTLQSSNVLYEGDIAPKDSEVFSIKLWIDNSLSFPVDSHFHGRFDIETT